MKKCAFLKKEHRYLVNWDAICSQAVMQAGSN